MSQAVFSTSPGDPTGEEYVIRMSQRPGNEMVLLSILDVERDLNRQCTTLISGARMFEISIFCVIGLAFGYWLFLWLLSRRKDVLHGHFVASSSRIPARATTPRGQQVQHYPPRALLNSIEPDLKEVSPAN